VPDLAMTHPPILLHVGYHKTATTWMQTRLFMPENGYRQLMDHQEIHDLIVGPHGLEFDAAPARALIETRLADLKPGEVPVISSEILSGQPFSGARESDAFAARLKQIVPDARILVSIRAQLKILPSVYMQYLLRGGTMAPMQFFTEVPKVGYHRFNPVHFEYHRLLGLYQRLFGAANTFVLQQERLQSGAQVAAEELAAFSGNDLFTRLSSVAEKAHPPSYPEYAIPVLRRVNHFQKAPMNHNPVLTLGHDTRGAYRIAGHILRRQPFKSLLADSKPATRFVEGHFAGHFDASNHELGLISANKLDLTRY